MAITEPIARQWRVRKSVLPGMYSIVHIIIYGYFEKVDG